MNKSHTTVSEASHPDAGKFYWTRNNIVAMLVGVDCECPEFRVCTCTSDVRRIDARLVYVFNTLTVFDNTKRAYAPATAPVVGNVEGGAFGAGFDIVAELTEEEVAYFVPQGE